jgi:hypothetical protein
MWKRDKFILLKYLDFEFQITFLTNTFLNDLITFFTLYYTPEIIESIVCYTNNVPQKAQDSSKSNTQTNQ